MDELTTVEEIKSAVQKAVVVEPEAVEVRALRPAYGRKQNATRIMGDAEARKLLEIGSL